MSSKNQEVRQDTFDVLSSGLDKSASLILKLLMSLDLLEPIVSTIETTMKIWSQSLVQGRIIPRSRTEASHPIKPAQHDLNNFVDLDEDTCVSKVEKFSLDFKQILMKCVSLSKQKWIDQILEIKRKAIKHSELSHRVAQRRQIFLTSPKKQRNRKSRNFKSRFALK